MQNRRAVADDRTTCRRTPRQRQQVKALADAEFELVDAVVERQVELERPWLGARRQTLDQLHLHDLPRRSGHLHPPPTRAIKTVEIDPADASRRHVGQVDARAGQTVANVDLGTRGRKADDHASAVAR